MRNQLILIKLSLVLAVFDGLVYQSMGKDSHVYSQNDIDYSLFNRDEVTTPIIDQITAQQIAGSAMFGTVENMREPQSQQVTRWTQLLLMEIMRYQLPGPHPSPGSCLDCHAVLYPYAHSPSYPVTNTM